MKIAYVYPGQGAQHAEMGAALYEYSAVYRETFDSLDEESGFDLKNTVMTGDNLSLTEYTQPALYAMGAAITAMFEKEGVKPDVTAGLSLGEYGALSAAGAIDIKDGVKLLRKRGLYMQQAVPAGTAGLAAIIGLGFETALEIAKECGVYVTNYNLETQIVLGGKLGLLENACSAAKQKGARLTKILDVSGPFHTPLLKSAGIRLKEELIKTDVKPLSCRVYSNYTGRAYKDTDDIREMLALQVYSTVLWYDCMKGMTKDGIGLYLELGPGGTLAGMIKKVDGGANVISVNNPSEFEKALAIIKEG